MKNPKILFLIVGMLISILIGISWALQGISIGDSSLAILIGIMFSWMVYFYLDLKELLKDEH